MSSERALRTCMQVLVLVNLVFVQMTGVAGLHWLAPLYALALAAPYLERFRERLLYRWLWNGGVVCFFLVLLRHVLQADLAFVLEDGLVLAVLCQVHLLNNLRTEQRPDLLFFNAFLIAIMTGFMNRGVGFPLAFLVFAPCFVVGLQFLSATRGGRVLEPAVARRLAFDGARRATLVLASSLLVFLVWPRDFERKAFFHGKLEMSTGGPTQLEIGFNEKLALGRQGPVGSSDREALRVVLQSGEAADVSPLWRGATLGATGGGGWHVMQASLRRALEPSDDPWNRGGGGLFRRPSAPRGAPRVTVTRYAHDTDRLFAPLGARSLRLDPEHEGGLVRARGDGTIETAIPGDVTYQLTLAPSPPTGLAGIPAADVAPELGPYVALPDNERVTRARRLAERLTAGLPADTEQHRLVTLLSEHLSRSFVYLPPGSADSARSLDEFLRGRRGGHCEYFASALGTMLRSLGIPCRVVTGYRGDRWDASGRVLTIGMRDAHAWVEVHDPTAGWYAVDPSPILVEGRAATSLWARLRTGAGDAWHTVTDFDAERRAAVYAWVRGLPGRAVIVLRERPLDAALGLVLVLLPVALLVHRRRARTQPAIRTYRLAVRRAGLRLRPGETPRELVERARADGLSPARLDSLETATDEHESARYAA